MIDTPKRPLRERQPPIQFRHQTVEERLSARTDEAPGALAAGLLARHLANIDAAIPTLNLTRSQALFLCDALLGRRVKPSEYGNLGEVVRGASHRRDLAYRWDIDLDAVLAKLDTYTPIQVDALVDAVERYERLPDDMDWDMALQELGLIREDS